MHYTHLDAEAVSSNPTNSKQLKGVYLVTSRLCLTQTIYHSFIKFSLFSYV